MRNPFFHSNNPFGTSDREDDDPIFDPRNGAESSPSSTFRHINVKKGRKSVQKRVVSVPIKDVEGSRLKGETPPPPDSWAWRKYGQKPIKGSPYPRGYYRCSSSKGCPARKQVERSRVDPKMLVITYSCEHNHVVPVSRNSNSATGKQAAEEVKAAAETETDSRSDPEIETESEEKFKDLAEELMLTTVAAGDEFTWFVEMETTSSTVLESPMFAERSSGDSGTDMAMFFPMREEDESLFADLEELPECSVVFRHHPNVGPQVGIC